MFFHFLYSSTVAVVVVVVVPLLKPLCFVHSLPLMLILWVAVVVVVEVGFVAVVADVANVIFTVFVVVMTVVLISIRSRIPTDRKSHDFVSTGGPEKGRVSQSPELERAVLLSPDPGSRGAREERRPATRRTGIQGSFERETEKSKLPKTKK